MILSQLKMEEQRFLASLKILNDAFYTRRDVTAIAKDLLGKIIVTYFDEELTAARITETEAYNGVVDKASHAYNNRRTKRTEIMYASGGSAYVYLCYGIHHLFNKALAECFCDVRLRKPYLVLLLVLFTCSVRLGL